MNKDTPKATVVLHCSANCEKNKKNNKKDNKKDNKKLQNRKNTAYKYSTYQYVRRAMEINR